MIEALAIIFTVAIILRVINTMYIKLPTSIGLFIYGTSIAAVILILKNLFPDLHNLSSQLIADVKFDTLLLDVFLGFLLFAGAIHVDLKELDCSRWSVLLFSTLGVLLTAGIVGSLVYYVAPLLGLKIPFLYALLFGTIVSPTDPIAVLAILEKTSLSKALLVKFKGESLFNDGLGVVLFAGVLLIINSSTTSSSGSVVYEIGLLFVQEVVGGLMFGALLGYIGYKAMQLIHGKPSLATMVSLAIVAGGYAIAHLLHISGPLAMVVAGLIIGEKIRIDVACEKIQESIIRFWKFTDEILNTVIFFIMGLVLVLLDLQWNNIIMALIATVILLIARYLSIIIPFSILGHKSDSKNRAALILTWGGLRGGISIALALSIRHMELGNSILVITSGVVFFSIIFQGLTIGKFYKRMEG